MRKFLAPLCAAVALPALIGASPAAAQLVLFETPGLTLGDDPVECSDQGSYRACVSDAGTERILSHDGLAPADRIPLDFHLYLPPEPASGPDGDYPLVVFIHGWGGSRTSIGGGVEGEMVPYAEAGYAVLAYSARAWGSSCGSAQQLNPECQDQWNHLADSRYEVRDTQYIAGLLADELSDTGDPLVDPQRIGVTGVSYGGGQSTQLAALRNRVVDLDGSFLAWESPAGKPMQIAAAAPYWPWTDLAYSLAPNGRSLDYVVEAPYRGPAGTHPPGVSKTSYVSGLFALGLAGSVFAPPGEDPDLNAWKATIDAGEPYAEPTAGPIIDALVDFRSGYYRIDPTGTVAPAPILFNQGWSDDLFPVSEPLRFMNRVRALHGSDFPAKLVASDFGHARASAADGAYARAAARAWLDHFLMGIGPEPGPHVRVRTQSCPGGTAASEHGAGTWQALSQGEVRLLDAAGGVIVSTAGPSAGSADSFDPIAGGDACARVADSAVAGSVVYDFPAAGPGGYHVMGSPTVIADLGVTGSPPEHAIVAARLLDVDASGDELLLARGVYRPEASGLQVFQLTPIGYHIEPGHHLQLELLGHEAPTFRPSNFSFAVQLADVDLRIPVLDAPDGGQILPPAPDVIPAGYLPEPGAVWGLLAGVAALTALRRRRA